MYVPNFPPTRMNCVPYIQKRRRKPVVIHDDAMNSSTNQGFRAYIYT